MASFIVFVLLFILPFVIAPFGVTQFEDPKVIICEGAVILLFLIQLFTNRVEFTIHKKQILLFAPIILLTCIDLVFFKTSVSFFGNPFRMQGIFLLWLLLLFSYLVSTLSFPFVRQSTDDFSWFKNRTFYGWMFVSLLGVELVAMFFLPLNASQRYVGTLGEPNALAAFAIFLWPFAWFGLSKTKEEILGKSLVLFFTGSILFLSDSRSAMVALGLQVLFIIFMRFRFPFSKAAIICFLLYLISYALPFFQHDPYENRVEVWKSAFYAGMLNPGIGQGFGNIEVALHNSAAGLDIPIQYYYVDSSHNIFLDWWVAGGFLSLAVLLYIVYLASRKFIQTQDTELFVLLLGTVTVLSFNPASVVGLVGFWWIIGQGFASSKD